MVESQLPGPESESHSDASRFVALRKTSPPPIISLRYTLITKGRRTVGTESRWEKEKKARQRRRHHSGAAKSL